MIWRTRSRRFTVVGRRDFFKGAAAGAAGLVVGGSAAPTETEAAVVPRPSVLPPTEAGVQAEFGLPRAEASGVALQQEGTAQVTTESEPASDFMVDVLKKLDFEYAAINPGSAFVGLHESFITYTGNKNPELLTCLHEEAAIAMSHGYAKAAGKPMLAMVHGVVGLLHGSMALFQAWADRVPLFLIVGMHRNPTGIVNLPHSAQDLGIIVRDFVKFDDETTTLERFAESAMRAYEIAMTPPRGPVMLVVPTELQEERISRRERPRVPELARLSPPVGDPNAVREVARMLVNAETPLLMPRKVARTQQGWDAMIELGELLQCPVDPGGLWFLAELPHVASALGEWRIRLSSRRDGGDGDERHVATGAQRARAGAQDDQHLLRTSVRPQQHSRLRPLRGSRSDHRRRRRSHAPDIDRGSEEAGHRRQASRVRGARHTRGCCASRRACTLHRHDAIRLGREPDQRAAHDWRAVGADQERRLGAGVGQSVHDRDAATADELRSSLPLQRRQWRASASATTRRRRWARRWRTANAAGCRSRSSATAI
jgi:hypothetical protein